MLQRELKGQGQIEVLNLKETEEGDETLQISKSFNQLHVEI